MAVSMTDVKSERFLVRADFSSYPFWIIHGAKQGLLIQRVGWRLHRPVRPSKCLRMPIRIRKMVTICAYTF